MRGIVLLKPRQIKEMMAYDPLCTAKGVFLVALVTHFEVDHRWKISASVHLSWRNERLTVS